MTESQKSVTEMLRLTATNNATFLTAIADHIEKLEARIIELEQELEDVTCKDENM